MGNRNLFTGIVTHENDVTELLVNLMQQKFFRDICLRWLLKESVEPTNLEVFLDSINSSDIKTQYNTYEYGIPDIVIENEQCFFIIENKIKNSTKETEDQRKHYPEIVIRKNKLSYSGIIFLIPRDYQLELDKEVYKTVNCRELHWNDFLSYLNKQQVGEISNVYRDALEQMQKVIDNTIVFDTRFLPYEKAMLMPKIIFSDLVDIDTCLSKLEKRSKWKLSISQNGIGYYTKGMNKFIGFSPKIENVDYFCAESKFGGKPIKDYSEWSDSENGYWSYSKLDQDFGNLIPDNPFCKYIYQQKILAIYTLADKIVELCKQYIRCNASLKFKFVSEQKNSSGIGCYFDSESNSVSARYFIGYGPNVKDDKFTLYVSIETDKSNLSKTDNEVISPYNNTIYNIRIGDESIDFDTLEEDKTSEESTVWLLVPMDKTCLCYDDLAQQQRAFNEEASKALEKAKTLNLNECKLKTATRVLFKNVETSTEDNTPSN